MRVSQKYRLELRWNSVKYPKDDEAFLKGAYFTGPVLSETAQVQPNDQLILDMTQQHLVFIPEYYQATLRWKGVDYKEDKIFLKGATLKGKHVNSLESLQDTDWVLIDCFDHEEERHPFHLVYWAEIRNESDEEKY